MRTRKYKLISPIGKIIEGRNISAFCETYNLRRNHIDYLLDGVYEQYHGWHTFTEKSLAHYAKQQRCIVNLKTGEWLSLRSSGRQILDKYNFTDKHYYNLLNGKLVQYKGWVLDTTYKLMYSSEVLPETNFKKPLDILLNSTTVSE